MEQYLLAFIISLGMFALNIASKKFIYKMLRKKEKTAQGKNLGLSR
ncbi:MAG: hypothetical protein ACOY35_02750 [Bacillota bacterium]